MAKTLLNAVNEIFKRTGIIAGDAAALTTLTDASRQRGVDVAIQVVNEGIISLYRDEGLPKERAESTITLVTNDRDYTLATDLVQLHFPLIDKTNNQYIYEYSGSYEDMLLADPEQDDTGLPQWGVISPVDGTLFLDRAPTSDENGNIYTYQYDKQILVSAASDTFPFTDTVFTVMVPAWVQLWKREMRDEFDGDLFRAGIGAASELLSQTHRRTDYNPR